MASLFSGLLLVVVVMYLVPTIIAWIRGHNNKVAITALNILLGWTLLGWVAALVWSLMTSKPQVIQVVSERS